MTLVLLALARVCWRSAADDLEAGGALEHLVGVARADDRGQVAHAAVHVGLGGELADLGLRGTGLGGGGSGGGLRRLGRGGRLGQQILGVVVGLGRSLGAVLGGLQLGRRPGPA